MKRLTIRTLAALAATGLLFTAAPAYGADSLAHSSDTNIIKPDPSERIIPVPRPPRVPCRIEIPPPGWDVPLYCDRHPIQPPPYRPGPIIPGPIIPGPVIPIETHG